MNPVRCVLLVVLLLPGLCRGQSALLTIDGDAATDQLGNAVERVGDVNGDGFPDVGVGIWRDDNNGNDSGSIRVISGRDGAILYTFIGDSAGDELGWSVGGVGDLNGDGFDDVLGGAIFDDDNGSDCGMIRVYSGKDGATLFTFYGDTVDDNLGGDAAAAGDVDNDGFIDIVGGMDRHDANGSDAGSARVFSGKDGTVLYTFSGDAPFDNFGFAVDGAGDVNGDGHDDVVVGTYLDDNTAANAGSVRVLSGKDGAVLFTFDGDGGNDNLGWAVSGAGDVNDDGNADIVAGAPLDDNNGASSGMVRVWSGSDGAILYTFDGDSAGDQLGYSVEGDFDADADGTSDLIGGAWLDDNAGGSSGSARVFSGRTGAVLFTLDGATGDRLGRAVAGAGDVDQDGHDDVIAGAFLADPNGTSSGRAIVASGCDSSATAFGAGCAGTGGIVPSLALTGCANVGGSVVLEIDGGLGGSSALLLFGATSAATPIGGGCLLLIAPVAPAVVPLPLTPGGAGAGSISVAATMPALATPVSFTMQAFVIDPGVPIGFAATNGVEVSVES